MNVYTNTKYVTVPIERYDELVSLETRVRTVVTKIYHDRHIGLKELLRILDTELSCELAEEIENEQNEMFKKEMRNEY